MSYVNYNSLKLIMVISKKIKKSMTIIIESNLIRYLFDTVAAIDFLLSHVLCVLVEFILRLSLVQ